MAKKPITFCDFPPSRDVSSLLQGRDMIGLKLEGVMGWALWVSFSAPLHYPLQ